VRLCNHWIEYFGFLKDTYKAHKFLILKGLIKDMASIKCKAAVALAPKQDLGKASKSSH